MSKEKVIKIIVHNSTSPPEEFKEVLCKTSKGWRILKYNRISQLWQEQDGTLFHGQVKEWQELEG